MVYTLNQIVANLRTISNAHQQLNSFGFGHISEMATSGVTNYPIMWVDNTSTVRNRRQTLHTMTIWLMDMVQPGEGNETEVLSDMIRIAEDVIAEIRHPDWTWSVNFDDVSIENFTERTPDVLAGCVFDVVFATIQPDDRCQIPSDSITRN